MQRSTKPNLYHKYACSKFFFPYVVGVHYKSDFLCHTHKNLARFSYKTNMKIRHRHPVFVKFLIAQFVCCPIINLNDNILRRFVHIFSFRFSDSLTLMVFRFWFVYICSANTASKSPAASAFNRTDKLCVRAQW